MITTAPQLTALLRSVRLPLGYEKPLQEKIADLLIAAQVSFTREVRLSEKDVIDFVALPHIGLEVKLKAAKRALYAQCDRYTKHERIHSLILVTNVPTGWPEEMNGKPCYVVNLAEAWL